MPKIRINDISRELEIKSRQALDFFHHKGHTSLHHSSSIDEPLAHELRMRFADPTSRSERAKIVDRSLIIPRTGKGPALVPAYSRAPSEKAEKKKKEQTMKKRRCRECFAYVPKTEFAAHVLRHNREAAERAARRTKALIKIQHRPKIPPAPHINAIVPPMPPPQPRLPLEKTCPECHRLVHPAVLDKHMSDHRAHPRLPDMKAARLSFVILPPGHDWDYRTVFDHYLHQSRAHNFARNVIDWTRIERIQRHLKPKLKCFGVKGWFGYAVYEFPYTERVVVECPIEGNATYILWGDWQNRVQLSKGELRHQYPNQHLRVIHQGDWIEDVRRALKEK